MRMNRALGLALVACAGAVWGCGDGRTLSPVAPSPSLSAPTSLGTPDAGPRTVPRNVDSDGDGYDDGPVVEGMPGPAMPNPNPVPSPDGAPVPVALTVNIVGPFGAGAFVPNPLQAAIGNTIVWTNSDLITHIIVLDDGTPVGNLLPGQSSAPVALATETMGYRCTLHPTMVGQVTTLAPGAAVPSDPSQAPGPDPSGYSPPADDDGYDDDYY